MTLRLVELDSDNLPAAIKIPPAIGEKAHVGLRSLHA
jgi:hypothetical protein